MKASVRTRGSGVLLARALSHALAALMATVVAIALGCSSASRLGGAGAVCALTTDCQEGLVCIAVAAARRCSSDLSTVQDPAVARGGAEAAAPPVDATTGDASAVDDAAMMAAPARPDGSVAPDTSAPSDVASDGGTDSSPPASDSGADASRGAGEGGTDAGRAVSDGAPSADANVPNG